MTSVEFIDLDCDAVEAGRRALLHVGNREAASQLSWLLTRMRNERMADIEAEAHALLLERRIAEYGDQTVRVQHLRSVS